MSQLFAFAHHKAALCTPRKARLLRGVLVGTTVQYSVAYLSLQRRAGSRDVLKLLKSALAQLPKEQYAKAKVQDIVVNEGPKRKMFMPRAQGRASLVLKRTSHISVKVLCNT